MKKTVALLLTLCLIIGMSGVNCMSAPSIKLAAITFDDGPSANTPKLLDGLRRLGAHATFFCTGTMAQSRLDILRRIENEGHQLANHTHNHKRLTSLSADGIRSEINMTRSILVSVGGERTYYVRPPYGSYNGTVKSVANCPLILWSVDTLDWKYRNADTVYNNIMRDTRDGSIILLHDLYSTSVEGALRAIASLQSQGYMFVTVEQLFALRGITPENGKAYSSVSPNGKLCGPAAPHIDVTSVQGGKTVSISSSENTAVYYTLDGTEPTEKSIRYTGPFRVDRVCTVKARAYGIVPGDIAQRGVWVDTASLARLYENDGIITLDCPGMQLSYGRDSSGALQYSKPFERDGADRLFVRSYLSGYADREMLFTRTQYGDWFSDVESFRWYYESVGKAVHRGILKGTQTNEFEPQSGMTRAMFITALSRLSGDSMPEFESSFTDVPADKWYSLPVTWAKQHGITDGTSETEFSPDLLINREQMCTMLGRYMKVNQLEIEKSPTDAFADSDKISDWAIDMVSALHEMGIISGVGDNMFLSQNTATRAECAKLLVTFTDKL